MSSAPLTLCAFAGPCSVPSCTDPPRCKGNHLSYEGGRFALVANHHKTLESHDAAPIGPFTLSKELEVVLVPHLSWALSTIAAEHMVAHHPYLFVDKQGRPFSDSTFPPYWKEMMRAAGLFGKLVLCVSNLSWL